MGCRNVSIMAALAAGGCLFASNALAADLITISGQIAGYEIDNSWTSLDDSGNYVTGGTTEKHASGGYVGQTFTITFQADGAGNGDSIVVASPEPTFQFGGPASWDGTTLNGDLFDGGSGGFDAENLFVSASGLGRFIYRTGYYTSDGTGNETDLILSLAPAGTVAVPEPSAWAMILLGFGLLGASLRRRGESALVRRRNRSFLGS